MSGENGQIPSRRRSQRPYRDSAIAYAVLATVVVVIAIATGGQVGLALAAGGAAFAAATGWTWWRLRRWGQRR